MTILSNFNTQLFDLTGQLHEMYPDDNNVFTFYQTLQLFGINGNRRTYPIITTNTKVNLIPFNTFTKMTNICVGRFDNV